MAKIKSKKKPILPRYVILKGADWYVRRSFPTNRIGGNGKPVYDQIQRKCFPQTAEHAAKVAAFIEAEYHAVAPVPVQQATVGDFLKAFLQAKKNSVEVRTYDGYDDLINRYVKNTGFSRLPVSDIKPLDVQRFYAELQDRAVSGAMIRKLNTVLSGAFNQAIRWETLYRNPCRGVILPRAKDGEIEIFEHSEARVFAETCFSRPEFLVLAFALETAMRPGEYLSLEWKNVDLKNLTVKVTRSAAFPKSGGFYYKEPKTKKSKRTIDISEKLAASLQEHRKNRQLRVADLTKTIAEPLSTGLQATSGFNYEKRRMKRKMAKIRLDQLIEHDLVFPSDDGTPISPHNLGVRTMKAACEAAGIAHHSIYSLRHTSLSLLLAAGVDIKTVSEKAGHSSPTITMSTYIHVLPSMRKNSTEKLAEALYG